MEPLQEGIIYTPCVQSNNFPIGLKKLGGGGGKIVGSNSHIIWKASKWAFPSHKHTSGC